MTQGGAHCERGLRSSSAPAKERKELARVELRRSIQRTLRSRCGPSFDERMQKAVTERHKKALASEQEQRKVLLGAIERGRSQPDGSRARPASASTNLKAMLQVRRNEMKRHEGEYAEHLNHVRDKLNNREPLFRIEHVNACLEMQERRNVERKRQIQVEEHHQWEHIRGLESKVNTRPLLVENANYRAPRTESAPTLGVADATNAGEPSRRPRSAPWGRAMYEGDRRIQNAVSQKWFNNSEWGKSVKQLKEKMDNRVPLSETSITHSK